MIKLSNFLKMPM